MAYDQSNNYIESRIEIDASVYIIDISGQPLYAMSERIYDIIYGNSRQDVSGNHMAVAASDNRASAAATGNRVDSSGYRVDASGYRLNEHGSYLLYRGLPIQSMPSIVSAPQSFIQPVLSQPIVPQPVLSQPIVPQPVLSQPIVPFPTMSLPVLESGGWVRDRFLKNMDDFICSICHEVCKDAMSLNCGHTFCQSCITRSEANFKSKCPECRTFSMQLVPDFSKRMKINGCTVSCIYKENGCTVTDALSRIFTHEYTCLFKKQPCNDCFSMVCLNQIETHKQSECTHRMRQCERCMQSVRYLYREEHDTKDCPELDKTCDYCDWTGKNSQLSDHMQQCQKVPIPCPYAKYGCPTVVIRQDMPAHVREIDHLSFVCETVEQLEQELYYTRMINQPEGPLRVRTHDHPLILCSDGMNDSCGHCKKPFVAQHNQLVFAYYCTSGCNYAVCPDCMPIIRMYKSKSQPSEPRFLFSFSNH
jgi:hypothetical protein